MPLMILANEKRWGFVEEKNKYLMRESRRVDEEKRTESSPHTCVECVETVW